MSIVIISRSGPDGKLRLEIPVNRPGADYEVEVVVRPPSLRPLTVDEYAAAVSSLTGSITDPNFERPPQPPLEERNLL